MGVVTSYKNQLLQGMDIKIYIYTCIHYMCIYKYVYIYMRVSLVGCRPTSRLLSSARTN